MATKAFKPAWCRFGLKSLFIAVALVSVVLGWFAHEVSRAREQRDSAAALEKLGAWVFYDYQNLTSHNYPPPGHPPAPRWLRSVIGCELFIDVVQVRSGPLGPMSIPPGVPEPRLRVRDADLVHLDAFPNLQVLHLDHSQITDAGMVHLRPLSKLTMLDLGETQVTDDGLIVLYELRNLEWLGLFGTHVTDKGVAELKQALPSLRVSR